MRVRKHEKLWENQSCQYQREKIGKAGMKAKLLLYLSMNKTLMWHLIKMNRHTAALKEEKKTINLHQSDRLCLKCKG